MPVGPRSPQSLDRGPALRGGRVILIGGSWPAGSGAGNPEAVVFFRRRRAAESPPSSSATSALYAASRDSELLPLSSFSAGLPAGSGRFRCSVMCGSPFGAVCGPATGLLPAVACCSTPGPELDGTGSRSGSAGRDGPGTDGRGGVGTVGVGTGLVGAVVCPFSAVALTSVCGCGCGCGCGCVVLVGAGVQAGPVDWPGVGWAFAGEDWPGWAGRSPAVAICSTTW